MTKQECREWGIYFERLEESKRGEIDLEKEVIEAERQRIIKEVEEQRINK